MASFEAIFEANMLQASQSEAQDPLQESSAARGNTLGPPRAASMAGYMAGSFNDRNPFATSTMAR